MRLNLSSPDKPALILATLGVLVFFGACSFFSDLGDEGLVGTSGHSFTLDDQFVIVYNGYSLNKVTFVVVRSWPLSSSAEDRLDDDRLITLGVGRPQVRRSDGRYESVDEISHLYFFDGYDLTEFPISMREDDFIDFHPGTMTSYGEILEYFKNYEVDE